MSPAIRIAIPNTKRPRFQYHSRFCSSESLNTARSSALLGRVGEVVTPPVKVFVMLKGLVELDGCVVSELVGDWEELSDSTFACTFQFLYNL
jgi:hypothetical protein